MAVITLSFYDPSDGSLLGTLDDTQCKVIELRPALYELGAGSFTVSRHLAAAEAAMLTKGVIVTATLPAISSAPVWAFVLHDDLAVLISHDEQGGEDLTLAGPGVMSILGNARLDEDTHAPVPPASAERGSSDQVGQWFWRNQAQGAIFTRAVEEGQNQPGTPLDLVTIDFDRTDDSDSDAWNVIVNDYAVPTGTSVLELADRLAQTGEFTAVMRPVLTAGVLSLALSAHQAYGVDRTASVSFAKGVNVLTELNRTTKYTRITHLITRDMDGAWDRFVTASPYDQARYAYLDVPETNDPDTLEKIATTYLDASELQNEEYELEITPTLLPFDDFDLGDIVDVHTGTGEHDLNHSAQRVIACRIVLDGAAVTGEARSLRIVPELSYREMRGMSATNATPGDAGTCCGPRPPLQPQAPSGGTVLFTRSWTYEAGGGTLNSTTGDYPWGDELDGGTQSAFATHYGRSVGASGSPATPDISVAAGQFVRVAGSVARNWFTDTAATKVYFIDWYTASGGAFLFSTTVLDPGPCTRFAATSFDFTTVVPATATICRVRMDQVAVQDNMTVQVIDDDADPGFEGQTPAPIGQPTEGEPGTSTQYMPIDAVIPHGYLAGDDVHQHAAAQVAYENEDLAGVEDVAAALDELVAGGGGGGGGGGFSGVGARNSADLALSTSGEAAIAMNTDVFDVGGYHDTGSNTSRMTVPASGYYLFTVDVRLSANVTGYIAVRVNGSAGTIVGIASTDVNSAGGVRTIAFSGVCQLTAGDYLEMYGVVSSACNAVASNPIPWFTVTQLAAGAVGELDYVQITADATISATTEAGANTVITGTSKAYAAVPTLIEVYLPRVELGSHASGNACVILLYDGATVIGRLGVVTYPANAIFSVPFFGRYRLTPTAATHQYIVKAYRTNANSTLYAGTGGTGGHLPASLRVSRA